MNKFPLPIVLPVNSNVSVAQPFGATTLALEPVGPHGEPHFHYGVDLVWGSDAHMFGTPLALPADGSKEAAYLQPPGDAINTPFVTFTFDGASGNHYTMVLAHVSKIQLANEYYKGQTVALVGNYGDLTPTPTPSNPFAATHLHLGLQCNGEWVDPLEYFDLNTFIVGPARDAANCTPRIQWAISTLTSELQALISQSK